MKRNVFKFRRLKWGDPEKFKMLPEDTTPRDHQERGRSSMGTIWSDKALVGVALALVVLAVAFSV